MNIQQHQMTDPKATICMRNVELTIKRRSKQVVCGIKRQNKGECHHANQVGANPSYHPIHALVNDGEQGII